MHEISVFCVFVIAVCLVSVQAEGPQSDKFPEFLENIDKYLRENKFLLDDAFHISDPDHEFVFTEDIKGDTRIVEIPEDKFLGLHQLKHDQPEFAKWCCSSFVGEEQCTLSPSSGVKCIGSYLFWIKKHPSSSEFQKCKPLIEVIPSTYDTIHYYTEEELKELKYTSCYQQLLKRKSDMLDDVEGILESMKKFSLFEELPNREQMLWGLSAVHASGLVKEVSEEKVNTTIVGIVPPIFKIGVNDGNVKWDYDVVKKVVYLQTTRACKSNEKIVVAVEKMTNELTLANYGFVDEINPFNSVEVSFSLESTTHKAKLDLLKTLGLYPQKFAFKKSQIMKELLILMRIYLIDIDKLTDSETLNKVTMGASVDPQLDISMLLELQSFCDEFLDEFPTSFEEDQEILEEYKNEANSDSQRVMNAIRLRMGEKEIVSSIKSQLATVLAAMYRKYPNLERKEEH